MILAAQNKYWGTIEGATKFWLECINFWKEVGQIDKI